jgi:hypothetical protein
VLSTSGPTGLFELLARLPGVRLDPGSPKGFLRAAVPPSAWIGTENQLVVADRTSGPALVHQHVVGGIVLAREDLAPTRAPATVARLLTTAVVDVAGVQDASAVLSAHRDAFGTA